MSSITMPEPAQELPAPRWLLDIPEAQRELHISRAALFRLLARGELPSIKIGRRRLIPVNGIERYIAARLDDSAHG